MYELEFNIQNVLDSLTGMSLKEKLESLGSLGADLEVAIEEVSSALEKISDEYFESVRQQLEESITKLILEQHLEDILQCRKTKGDKFPYFLNFDGHTYHMRYYTADCENWTLHIYIEGQLPASVTDKSLRKFADLCGLPIPNKSQIDNLWFDVKTSELFEQIKSIALKVKGQ